MRNNKKVYGWLADKNGDIRIGVRFKNKGVSNDVAIYYRDTNEGSWEILQKMDYFEESRLIPQCFDDDDPNILLVSNKLESEGDSADEDGKRCICMT